MKVVELPALSEEEARTFRILTKEGLTVNGLAALLSCSTAKARKILQGLVVKGVAEMTKHGRQNLYGLKVKVPTPLLLRSISDSGIKFNEGIPKKGVTLQPALGLENMESLVKLFWKGIIKGHKVILYPYYSCKIVEGDKRYVKASDMITNKIDERISAIFTKSYSQLPF